MKHGSDGKHAILPTESRQTKGWRRDAADYPPHFCETVALLFERARPDVFAGLLWQLLRRFCSMCPSERDPYALDVRVDFREPKPWDCQRPADRDAQRDRHGIEPDRQHHDRRGIQPNQQLWQGGGAKHQLRGNGGLHAHDHRDKDRAAGHQPRTLRADCRWLDGDGAVRERLGSL